MTKLLSDAELDETKSGLLNGASFVSHQTMELVFAQAKLANRIQKQAAEICKSLHTKEEGFAIGYNAALKDYRTAILAMEIE